MSYAIIRNRKGRVRDIYFRDDPVEIAVVSEGPNLSITVSRNDSYSGEFATISLPKLLLAAAMAQDTRRIKEQTKEIGLRAVG